MKASWWQTLALAAVGAAGPVLVTASQGGTVNLKTAAASVAAAILTALANLLRSPLENPPTMIAPKPPNS